MTRDELVGLIRKKRSYLCVGLDTDLHKIPAHLRKHEPDPVFAFNRQIIDATIDLSVAYKPNLAFYECLGADGWRSLEKTIAYLHAHPRGPVFCIADAKRSDIGNTADRYASTFFDLLGFDAVTVNPYMGHDSVKPFLDRQGKWTVILALTSNPGSRDFQLLQPQIPALLDKLGIRFNYWKRMFELVIEESITWGHTGNTMFVAGATHPGMLSEIRELIPDHFLLIPGVGTQGGNLADVSQAALNKEVGILVNVSRQIIYASGGDDFDKQAGRQAAIFQEQMEKILVKRGLV